MSTSPIFVLELTLAVVVVRRPVWLRVLLLNHLNFSSILTNHILDTRAQECSQEFSKGVPAGGKTCRPWGSFFSPVLPSSRFFSKGCARAPFSHPLATPLQESFRICQSRRRITRDKQPLVTRLKSFYVWYCRGSNPILCGYVSNHVATQP